MRINDPFYGRNLAVDSIICIKDRSQFNRLVKREYSRLVSIGVEIRGKPLAEIAMMYVLREHPGIWEFHIITDLKNTPGVLVGYVPEKAWSGIPEVLA